jgi:hypothetical protein
MAYLLTRNSRIEEDLIDQLFNSSERRLARLLLLLANFGKEGSPQPISPNISQETLADMIGTTRSRVSRFMNKFRKLGLISYNGHIEVHNSLLNAVLHEKPQLKEDWTAGAREEICVVRGKSGIARAGKNSCPTECRGLPSSGLAKAEIALK